MLLIVAAILVWVRKSEKFDYERKTAYTLLGLPFLVVLSGIQAVGTKIPNISQAWWLLAAIFVVLFVNTMISKKQYEASKMTKPEATKPGEEKKDPETPDSVDNELPVPPAF